MEQPYQTKYRSMRASRGILITSASTACEFTEQDVLWGSDSRPSDPADAAQLRRQSLPKKAHIGSVFGEPHCDQTMNKSAPVRIPVVPAAAALKRKTMNIDCNWDDDVAGDSDEEMIPPHEIVARKAKMSHSVLEGVGRTLKGRDLRQVRNAVWRQTGFIG